MTSQPVDIFLSIGQKGSPNTIPNVGALAVANHILRTERNRDEVDVFSANEFIDSVNIPEYNYAVTLGSDPRTVQELDDAFYQYLLYYYLMRLNRPDSIRIIPRINPIYVGGVVSTDLGAIDEILRSRTYEFRNQLNSATQTVNDLNLRVNYAPVIAQLMKKYPLSSKIASFLNDTFMKTELRYSERSTKRRTVIPLGGNSIVGPQLQETFYATMEDVPLNEILFGMVEAAHIVGTGFIYQTTFADSITMMAKISDQSNMHTIYEYQIGSYVNRVYEHCPFIVYSYGLLNSFIMPESLQGYVPVIDNDSDYWIGSELTPSAIYLGQWLEGGMSLREFIAGGISGRRFDEDGEVIDQTRSETFKSIMIAILASLGYLYKELGFVHNNLTFDNIVIRQLENPIRIELPGMEGRYFNSNCIPTIINLSVASLLGGPEGPNVPLINISDSQFGITTDARVLTDIKNIIDYEKLLTSILQFHETFDSWRDGDTIVNDLISFHIQLLTDTSIDPVRDQDDFAFVKERLLNVISTPGLSFRSLPFQWDKYNVSDSVEELIKKWILSDDLDGDETEKNIDPSFDLTAMITSQIDDNGIIVTSTYSGMLLNSVTPRGIRKLRTKNVEQSLNLLLLRLSNAYDDQIAFLRRDHPFDRYRRNMADAQAAYRDQINGLIRRTVISEGRYWTSTSQVVDVNESTGTLIMKTPVVETITNVDDIMEELLEP